MNKCRSELDFIKMLPKFNPASDLCMQRLATPISRFICMIILTSPSDCARIKFHNYDTLEYTEFSHSELKDFLLKIKEQEKFKFQNFFKLDYYVNWMFPKKRYYVYKTFTFDECAINTLFEDETDISNHIKRNSLPRETL